MYGQFVAGVTKDKKVYYAGNIDYGDYEELLRKLGLEYKKRSNLCCINIFPKRDASQMDGYKEYLYPEGEWSIAFLIARDAKENKYDEAPKWWSESHQKKLMKNFEEWKKEVYSEINLKEAINPVNPANLPEVKGITKEHITLLKRWSKECVYDRELYLGFGLFSVKNKVWFSAELKLINPSATNLASDSINPRCSSRFTCWSLHYLRDIYLMSLFRESRKRYMYKNAVRLWKMGLVPSFDGKYWRLHSGDKGKIVFRISRRNLDKLKEEKQ